MDEIGGQTLFRRRRGGPTMAVYRPPSAPREGRSPGTDRPRVGPARPTRSGRFRIADRRAGTSVACRPEGRARHRWIHAPPPRESPTRTRSSSSGSATGADASAGRSCTTRCAPSPAAACTAATAPRTWPDRHRVQPLRHAGAGHARQPGRRRGPGAPPAGRGRDHGRRRGRRGRERPEPAADPSSLHRADVPSRSRIRRTSGRATSRSASPLVPAGA